VPGRDDGGVTTTAVDVPAVTARSSPPLLPAALAAAAVVLVASLAAGTALHFAGDQTPLAAGVTDWWLMPVLGGSSFGGAGLWLVRARPRLAVGWLFAAVGLVLATSYLALELGLRLLPEGGQLVFWYANWAWATCLLTVGTVVPLLLPDGRLPSRRWRPALALAATAVTVTTVQWALTPYGSWSPVLGRAGIGNPVGADWVTGPTTSLLVAVLDVTAVVVALSGLAVRWHRATDVVREQLRWIALGAAAGVLLFGLGFAVGPVATALGLVPLPAACLVAVLRHRLWDLDVVLSRSLVYLTLTAVVVAVYVTVVALLGTALGGPTGAPIVATALVAVGVLPLHQRLQALVNRLVHGDRDEPFAVLSRLGARLEAAQDDTTVSEQVLPDVVAAVARSLRVPYAALVLADGSAVEAGRSGGAVEQLPLTYAGQQVGRLLVTPRPGGLTRRDRAALATLASQAGVAVRTVALAREVRRSREDTVAAREEERRRLYRDLHDGLGPSLAALALQVEAARHLVGSQPDRADSLLVGVLRHLRGTVDEVRVVVHGLRPPALDDLGLVQALRELGGRFRSDSLQVDVDVTDVEGAAAAVEVATYSVRGRGADQRGEALGGRATSPCR
jgi:signal transduction histidine kinase